MTFIDAGGGCHVAVPEAKVVNATDSGDTVFSSSIATMGYDGGLTKAQRAGTAGGALNAAQLESGLQKDASLDLYRSQMSLHAVVVLEPKR